SQQALSGLYFSIRSLRAHLSLSPDSGKTNSLSPGKGTRGSRGATLVRRQLLAADDLRSGAASPPSFPRPLGEGQGERCIEVYALSSANGALSGSAYSNSSEGAFRRATRRSIRRLAPPRFSAIAGSLKVRPDVYSSWSRSFDVAATIGLGWQVVNHRSGIQLVACR